MAADETALTCREHLRAGEWRGPADDRIRLDHAGRLVRRRRLTTAGGLGFLIDLPGTAALEAGDALRLSDGRIVAVEAAAEPLLAVSGPDLARYAWHIGNRHTPCQIAGARLLIARDPVLATMLAGLGATLAEAEAPFHPEGGAYGPGRTMGHEAGGHGAGGHQPGPAEAAGLHGAHHHVHHHGSHQHPDEPEDLAGDPE